MGFPVLHRELPGGKPGPQILSALELPRAPEGDGLGAHFLGGHGPALLEGGQAAPRRGSCLLEESRRDPEQQQVGERPRLVAEHGCLVSERWPHGAEYCPAPAPPPRRSAA